MQQQKLSIPGKETLMNNKFPNANEIVDVLHACSDFPQMICANHWMAFLFRELPPDTWRSRPENVMVISHWRNGRLQKSGKFTSNEGSRVAL